MCSGMYFQILVSIILISRIFILFLINIVRNSKYSLVNSIKGKLCYIKFEKINFDKLIPKLS